MTHNAQHFNESDGTYDEWNLGEFMIVPRDFNTDSLSNLKQLEDKVKKLSDNIVDYLESIGKIRTAVNGKMFRGLLLLPSTRFPTDAPNAISIMVELSGGPKDGIYSEKEAEEIAEKISELIGVEFERSKLLEHKVKREDDVDFYNILVKRVHSLETKVEL